MSALPPSAESTGYGGAESTAYGGAGAGLGLAIAREMVALHGSALEVESSPGQGARFSFSLSAAAVAGFTGYGGAKSTARGSTGPA